MRTCFLQICEISGRPSNGCVAFGFAGTEPGYLMVYSNCQGEKGDLDGVPMVRLPSRERALDYLSRSIAGVEEHIADIKRHAPHGTAIIVLDAPTIRFQLEHGTVELSGIYSSGVDRSKCGPQSTELECIHLEMLKEVKKHSR
jgi:hypothetical protein